MSLDDRIYDAFRVTTAEEFLRIFGIPKPAVSAEIILYCHYGLKAREIADLLAVRFGYQNVRFYLGGWLEYHSQCAAAAPEA